MENNDLVKTLLLSVAMNMQIITNLLIEDCGSDQVKNKAKQTEEMLIIIMKEMGILTGEIH